MDQNFATTDGMSFKLKKMEVTPMNIVCSVLTICTYIADVVTDILVAVKYFNEGQMTSFTFTVCFITVPAVTMAVFSLTWYLSDLKNSEVSVQKWIIRIIFFILGLAPVLRNLEALYCGLRSIKSKTPYEKEHYARRMIYENTDATFLRLFEAFMECAPQLLLHICIFSQKPNIFAEIEILPSVAIFTSLISMSVAITSYQILLRRSLDDKKELSCSVTIVPFLWRFFEIISRVMVLGLIVSLFPFVFWIVCTVHYIVMSIWIFTMNTDFCDGNRCGERIYNLLVGVVFIFCYFNIKDTPTQQRCIIFYVLIFVENTALMIVWFHYYSSDVHLKLPAMIIQFLSFVLGIVIMIVYYVIFHPTRGKIGQSNIFESQVQNGETSITLRDVRKNTEEIDA